jgi:hypothetical protein
MPLRWYYASGSSPEREYIYTYKQKHIASSFWIVSPVVLVPLYFNKHYIHNFSNILDLITYTSENDHEQTSKIFYTGHH